VQPGVTERDNSPRCNLGKGRGEAPTGVLNMGLFCSFFFTLFLFHIHIQPLSGLGPSPAFPQVSPGAIISLRSERKFHIQPLSGF
jgi:hypothetical protein